MTRRYAVHASRIARNARQIPSATRPEIHKGCGGLLIGRSPSCGLDMRRWGLRGCGGFGRFLFSLGLQPEHQELMLDLNGRRQIEPSSESHGVRHRISPAATTNRPSRTGTTNGGTSQGPIPVCIDMSDLLWRNASPKPTRAFKPSWPFRFAAQPCAAASVFGGSSETIASVVISRPATEAAPCNAARTTLVGSMMPFAIMLTYSPDCASKPYPY